LRLAGDYQVKGRPYFADKISEHLAAHVDAKSSISLIRYFPQPTATTPSNEHVDTGLLTFIICAAVPGLQVKDRESGQWIEVEKLVSPLEDMFVILGRKMELLAQETPPYFTATEHRVALPPDTERHSLLFFLDVKQ